MPAEQGTRDYGTAQDIHGLYERLCRYADGAKIEGANSHADLYNNVAAALQDAYQMMMDSDA